MLKVSQLAIRDEKRMRGTERKRKKKNQNKLSGQTIGDYNDRLFGRI